MNRCGSTDPTLKGLTPLSPKAKAFVSHDLNQMNITESSNKAEIISTALEFIDDKDRRIDQLEQQQVLLIGLASFLLCLLLAL